MLFFLKLPRINYVASESGSESARESIMRDFQLTSNPLVPSADQNLLLVSDYKLIEREAAAIRKASQLLCNFSRGGH